MGKGFFASVLGKTLFDIVVREREAWAAMSLGARPFGPPGLSRRVRKDFAKNRHWPIYASNMPISMVRLGSSTGSELSDLFRTLKIPKESTVTTGIFEMTGMPDDLLSI